MTFYTNIISYRRHHIINDSTEMRIKTKSLGFLRYSFILSVSLSHSSFYFSFLSIFLVCFVVVVVVVAL